MDLVAGVDVGGTKTAAALVDRDGRTVGDVLTAPTHAGSGPAAVLDVVAGLVRQAGAAAGGPVRAVGVGTAGVVDVREGRIVSATETFPGWPGTSVREGLLSRLSADHPGVRVHVENDVDAHATGEAWKGAGSGYPTMLMVAVGTGVGAAFVVDGAPWRGAHHVAGELGHAPVPGAEGLRCTCGREGHLEALGAGPALHRRYLARGGDASCADARDVVARAGDGEEAALRAVHDAATAVGRAVAGAVTVLDPHAVVVGGGLAGAGPVWWSPMEAALRADLVPPLSDLAVLPARLGPAASVVGAARGAWTRLDSSGED